MAKKPPHILKKGFSIVFSYLLEYKKELLFLSFLSLIVSITSVLSPLFFGYALDAIGADKDIFLFGYSFKEVFIFAALWVLTMVLTTFVSWVLNFENSSLGANLYIRYLVKAWTHMLELPMAFHKVKNSGSVINQVFRSGGGLWRMSDNFSALAPQILSVIIALVLAFFIEYRLALIMIFGIVIYIFAMVKSVSYSLGLRKHQTKAWDDAAYKSYDSISNVDAIKTVAGESYESQGISSLYNKAKNKDIKIFKFRENFRFLQNTTSLFVEAIVLVVSIFLIIKSDFTIGQLVIFNRYTAMLFRPFFRIGETWRQFEEAVVSLEKTEKILQLPKEKYIPNSHNKLKEIGGDIEFQNVDFYYEKGKEVLKDISFKVKRGSVVALIGESGVGKSTLIDLLVGFYFPKKGKILIDGVDIKKIPLGFLRENIGVVPQEVVLFNDTIEKNITYGSFHSEKEDVRKAAKKALADAFIDQFPKKWKTIVGDRGVKLSVGQKQRVAVARAILRNPKILILDEPTAALDAKTEKEITSSLEKLMEGKTTFIVAHRLSTVRKADTIIVLKDGEITEMGTHDELLRNKDGEYHRLYELQIGLHD